MPDVEPTSPERKGALVLAWWWAVTAGGPLVAFLGLPVPGIGAKIESNFFALLIFILVIHFVITLLLTLHIQRQKVDRWLGESIFVFLGLLVGGWVVMSTCAFVGCLALTATQH